MKHFWRKLCCWVCKGLKLWGYVHHQCFVEPVPQNFARVFYMCSLVSSLASNALYSKGYTNGQCCRVHQDMSSGGDVHVCYSWYVKIPAIPEYVPNTNLVRGSVQRGPCLCVGFYGSLFPFCCRVMVKNMAVLGGYLTLRCISSSILV